MTNYEYGIAHRSDDIASGEVHRWGMSMQQAHEWVDDWEADGGDVDAFFVIRREVGEWKRDV